VHGQRQACHKYLTILKAPNAVSSPEINLYGVFMADLKHTFQQAHEKSTNLNIELAAELSTTGGKSGQSAVDALHNKELMEELVRANSPAARKALEELKQNEIKPGVSTAVYWKEGVGGNTNEAIAAIQESLKDAGISVAKDVQPHEARHDAMAIPQTKQLGG
jgi:hypothetical protein